MGETTGDLMHSDLHPKHNLGVDLFEPTRPRFSETQTQKTAFEIAFEIAEQEIKSRGFDLRLQREAEELRLPGFLRRRDGVYHLLLDNPFTSPLLLLEQAGEINSELLTAYFHQINNFLQENKEEIKLPCSGNRFVVIEGCLVEAKQYLITMQELLRNTNE